MPKLNDAVIQARKAKLSPAPKKHINSNNHYDTKPLKARIHNWLVVYEELAPELSDASIRNQGPCPKCGGDTRFRLFNNVETTGGVVCNECEYFSDGISVLMWLRGWSFRETIDALEEYLLVHEDDEITDQAMYTSTGDSSTATRQDPDPWVQKTIQRIKKEGKPRHPRVRDYYKSRGLSIDPPRSVGFVAEERYVDDIDDLTLPMMASPFTSPTGQIVGLLRTFLDPDGDGKADVASPKRFTRVLYPGALRGAAIRLREPTEVLGIAEGIETAEAVFEATGTATWACGSANGIASFVLPANYDQVRCIEIWADHDKSGVGRDKAIILIERLFAAGICTRLIIPPVPDTDWLDVLIQEGPEALQNCRSSAPVYDPSDPATVLPQSTSKPRHAQRR